MRITYVGHATTLIEIGGVTVLTDPNFDPALGRYLPRVAPPAIALDALPLLDAVMITHAHLDHLSLVSLAALGTSVPTFAPPSLAQWLRAEGFGHVVALAPGGEADLGHGVRVTTARARHMGARYGYDRWRGDANMYLFDSGSESCFFAGDTGLGDETHQMPADLLGRQGRKLDVALLPIGAGPWYKPRFRNGHLTSADAFELMRRLDARVLMPYHWGTFRHVTAGAHDAIRELQALLPAYELRERVRIVEPGGRLEIEGLGKRD